MAGALDVRTERLHTTGASRKNVSLFCQLLWLLASRYRRAHRIHLDYCSIHSERKTRQVLAALAGRIVLHFLPLYCPDANRIERVWQDLPANVTRPWSASLLENARRLLDAYRWRRAVSRVGQRQHAA